jgi:2-hydroxychromene-2-carboxylate isomerase
MSAIDFHFDYLSPYAYLAWTQIHPLAARHGREVRPVPTLFAALLAHGKTKGPAEIPAKAIWVIKDTTRTARKLGVPFAPPPAHPFNPLLALRLSGLLEGELQKRIIDTLYAATWGGGPGVEDPATVARLLTEAGLDGPALVQQAQAPEAKERLRAATERAIAAGVFGVPTMVADGELFWGLDAFGHLDTFLAGADPLRPDDLVRWSTVRPSATRPGAQ